MRTQRVIVPHELTRSDSEGMPVQDDGREQQMVSFFNLTVPHDRGRSDVDAYLRLAELDEALPFELKSTTTNSVSTVRDFGPEHIVKWRGMHWIFAFYLPQGPVLTHCYYASPADMHGWISRQEQSKLTTGCSWLEVATSR